MRFIKKLSIFIDKNYSGFAGLKTGLVFSKDEFFLFTKTRDNSNSSTKIQLNSESEQDKSIKPGPNKPSEPEGDSKMKSPVYPHTPVKVYENVALSKKDISKNFKGVPLIYMWFNKITGKVYIGSSIDGSKRLSGYFQPSILKKKSIIYQSILKHGHANFSLSILEVYNRLECTKEHILNREKFYLDWSLKTYGIATYNMLNNPGSSMGYKHTKKILLKMSEIKKGKLNPMFNKVKSKEFLEYMTKDKRGINNPRYNKGRPVHIYNENHQYLTSYTMLKAAAQYLNTSSYTIAKYLDSGKQYKNVYMYSKLQK